MADVTVQYPCDVLPMGKGVVANSDLGILKSLVTFIALRMGDLDGLRQGNLPLGVTSRACRLLPFMTFEAGLFGRAEGGWVVRVMVDIVVARGAGILQLFDMETVRNRDIVRVKMGESLLDIKHSLMATNTVRIDLIEFGRKTRMFPSAGEGKDIDARD